MTITNEHCCPAVAHPELLDSSPIGAARNHLASTPPRHDPGRPSTTNRVALQQRPGCSRTASFKRRDGSLGTPDHRPLTSPQNNRSGAHTFAGSPSGHLLDHPFAPLGHAPEKGSSGARWARVLAVPFPRSTRRSARGIDVMIDSGDPANLAAESARGLDDPPLRVRTVLNARMCCVLVAPTSQRRAQPGCGVQCSTSGLGLLLESWSASGTLPPPARPPAEPPVSPPVAPCGHRHLPPNLPFRHWSRRVATDTSCSSSGSASHQTIAAVDGRDPGIVAMPGAADGRTFRSRFPTVGHVPVTASSDELCRDVWTCPGAYVSRPLFV